MVISHAQVNARAKSTKGPLKAVIAVTGIAIVRMKTQPDGSVFVHAPKPANRETCMHRALQDVTALRTALLVNCCPRFNRRALMAHLPACASSGANETQA
jgi:hypothetical protein